MINIRKNYFFKTRDDLLYLYYKKKNKKHYIAFIFCMMCLLINFARMK